MRQQSLPPYGEPASRQLLTHLSRHGFPYGSPPVKRDVRSHGGSGTLITDWMIDTHVIIGLHHANVEIGVARTRILV
jgi:hypothetical protein